MSPHPARILLQYCQWNSGWLSVFSLFNSLTSALLPEFISLHSSALLPTWQFQSWSTVQSLYSRWWAVFITLAWSAQYPNYRAGTPCAWGWTRVTKRHPILLWGIYSENPSSVPGSLSTPPPGLRWINSISSHFFRAENQQKPASLGGMSQVVHGNESHPLLAEELRYLLNGLRKKARLTVLAYPGILVLKKTISTTSCPRQCTMSSRGGGEIIGGEGEFSSWRQEECFGQKSWVQFIFPHLRLLETGITDPGGYGQCLPAC